MPTIRKTVTAVLNFQGKINRKDLLDFVKSTPDNATFDFNKQRGDRSYEASYTTVTATWTEV